MINVLDIKNKKQKKERKKLRKRNLNKKKCSIYEKKQNQNTIEQKLTSKEDVK